MSLTKDDLQAIRQLLDRSLLPIEQRLQGVEERLFGVERRLSHVEVRLEGVEGEQIATRADIKELYTLGTA
jgi:hypothetical protein